MTRKIKTSLDEYWEDALVAKPHSKVDPSEVTLERKLFDT